jgi:hypothetical protein
MSGAGERYLDSVKDTTSMVTDRKAEPLHRKLQGLAVAILVCAFGRRQVALSTILVLNYIVKAINPTPQRITTSSLIILPSRQQ